MNFSNRHNLFYRAVITWLLFIPVVFANAAIRDLLYKPYTGELPAHQISTVTASLAFVLLAHFVIRDCLYSASTIRLWLIGLLWVALTVTFEFALGRLVTGASWNKLLYDYNVFKGRIWTLLLLTLLVTPFIVRYMSYKRSKFHFSN